MKKRLILLLLSVCAITGIMLLHTACRGANKEKNLVVSIVIENSNICSAIETGDMNKYSKTKRGYKNEDTYISDISIKENRVTISLTSKGKHSKLEGELLLSGREQENGDIYVAYFEENELWKPLYFEIFTCN